MHRCQSSKCSSSSSLVPFLRTLPRLHFILPLCTSSASLMAPKAQALLPENDHRLLIIKEAAPILSRRAMLRMQKRPLLLPPPPVHCSRGWEERLALPQPPLTHHSRFKRRTRMHACHLRPSGAMRWTPPSTLRAPNFKNAVQLLLLCLSQKRPPPPLRLPLSREAATYCGGSLCHPTHLAAAA